MDEYHWSSSLQIASDSRTATADVRDEWQMEFTSENAHLRLLISQEIAHNYATM